MPKICEGPATTGWIGGQAHVAFCAMVPFGLGGTICGSLRVMVLEGDEVPMLFPIRLCYAHGMVLDTTQNKVFWTKHDS